MAVVLFDGAGGGGGRRRRHHNLLLFFYLLLLLTFTSYVHPFVVPLTHRDSPSSPFFDPNATHAARWRAAYRGSLAGKGLISMASGFHEVGGEYHMTLGLGLPSPVNVSGFVDVAGPYILTPCVDPLLRVRWPHGTLYDATKSYTNKVVPCDDHECAATESWCFSYGGPKCGVYFEPADGVMTTGILMHDFAMIPHRGDNIMQQDLGFVCAGDDHLGTRTASTRVGFTGSIMFSLVHQLAGRVSYRFAHCFARGASNANSHLRFNDSVEFTGLIMPLTLCTGFKYSFEVRYMPPPLVGISVQSERLNMPPETFDSICNVLLDSLSPLTLLPKAAYDMVEAAVRRLSKLPEAKLPYVDEPWNLCFNGSERDISPANLPSVTLHFKSEYSLGLALLNTYTAMNDGRVCLMMAATDDRRATIGTIAQQDVYVAYDIKNMLLAMNPNTNCG